MKKTEEEPMDVDKQQISVTYAYYIQTANLIVYHIRRKEEESQGGLKQGEIESLILEEKADEIEDEEQFAKAHKILRYIIARLINHDNVLLIKRQSEKIEDRVLMVHANYDPDSRNFNNLEKQQERRSNENEDDEDDEEEKDEPQESEQETQNKKGKKKKNTKSAKQESSVPSQEDAATAKEAMDYEQ